MIRKATTEDIKALTKLLYQADAVHNGIRPDLFKSDTPKYNEQELEAIINDSTKPIFVYDDGEVVGHAFCQITEVKNRNNITLNVWEGNDPAMAFYKSMGMKIQKTGMEIKV